MESIHYDAMMNHVILAITPVINFSTGKIEKLDAVFTYQFQNIPIILMKIMNEKDEVYNHTLNEIERILKLIDEELN